MMFYNKIKKILKLNNFRQRKFYTQLIKKNDLCFDIGANVGNKSRLFLSLGAQVVAFEPQSYCINKLKLIKHKKFKFLPYAIGSKNELSNLLITNEVEVATLSSNFLNYVESDNLYQKKTEKVIVKKLDLIIKKYGLPDFCKVDVEGFELEIFSSLSYKLPLIEFEFTGGFINDTIKIVNILTQNDTKFNYTLNEKSNFELSKWVDNNELITRIKNLPNTKLHGNIFVRNKIN